VLPCLPSHFVHLLSIPWLITKKDEGKEINKQYEGVRDTEHSEDAIADQ
jgi:hypothetical protein